MTDMRFVSIDIETTGLDPQKDQLLSIAIVVGQGPDDSADAGIDFVIKHERIEGNPYALTMNHKNLKRIANGECMSWANALYQIKTFLSKFGNEFIVIGKNFGAFDLQFIKQQPEGNEFVKQFFGHRYLDPGSLYFDPKIDSKIPNLQTCMERAGLEASVAHESLSDAQDTLEVVRRYYES